MGSFDRYPDRDHPPHTDRAARVCRFRHEKNIRAVRITNGSYRNAPASGVFELYEPERDDPVEVLPKGKRQVKVICAWHGDKPNREASGLRIKVSSPDSRVEVMEKYSGEVVDNIGCATDPAPLNVVVPSSPVSGVGTHTATEFSAIEGRELLRLHKQRERDRRLVARKKRQVTAETGSLECEACRFDFAAVYGPLGTGYAECHHRLPFSQAAGERRTRLSDLAVVCANCHRMLHRRPWHTVEELRELVRSRRPGRRGA